MPRPWDQQLSLRMQQVLAFETDLLEHADLFDGSHVMEGLVAKLKAEAREELDRIVEHGGAVDAVDDMKSELVASNAARLRRIEAGEQTVIGVNEFTETTESPLMSSEDGGILVVDPAVEQQQIDLLEAHRSRRDEAEVERTLDALRAAAETDENLVEASIACAKAGVTTGEWSQALRAVFGEYRGPTGVGERAMAGSGASLAPKLAEARQRVAAVEEKLGRRLRILVGKPGLDGHSNGAEQVAIRARDLGMEVVYEGIRLTPAQIVRAAVDEDVALVGLSILSGSHLELVPRVVDGLREAGHDVPVVAGGIIPPEDARKLEAAGVAAVFTPKDFDLTDVLVRVAELAVAEPAPA